MKEYDKPHNFSNKQRLNLKNKLKKWNIAEVTQADELWNES